MEYSTEDINDSELKFEQLLSERRVAREFQSRRHTDWNENYELYRNKVRTNRLTQRQAVTVPLMKESIKTLLSRIDESPKIEWRELTGDEDKRILYQEIWDDQFNRKKFEWIDIIDKKNVLLYGLSTRKLNLGKEGIEISVLDVFDIVFDPLTNPADIDSARFIIHQNIFRSLREILADPRYSEEGKEKLKLWSLGKDAIIQSEKNRKELDKKQGRLKSMGVQSDQFKHFAGGDNIVNLCEHYTKVWNGKEFEKRVVVYANDEHELMDEKLKDLIGVDFWPFVVWSEDLEANDIYPDGVADLIRTPNRILNIWFSQQTENRTLQNFQMHWYDATVQGYQPQTYEPGPGRMLPAPGDPNKTILPVQINGLDETLNSMDFLIKMVERGSGATAIEKGTQEKRKQTLGEAKIQAGQSAERIKGITKFYRSSWYELAVKWDKMMHENAPRIIKLYKTNHKGVVFPKTIYPGDWKSKVGYDAKVSSTSEQERNKMEGIQKWNFIIGMFPNNAVVKKIATKRSLELVDITPQELKEIEEAEEQMQEQPQQPQQTSQPEQENLVQSLQSKMQQLNA